MSKTKIQSLAISLSEAEPAVIKCMEAGLVPILSSQPGVGKSALIKQIADKFELELIDVRLAQCEPADLLGLPKIGEKKATYLPMSIFPIKGDTPPKNKKGWLLFLDEIRNADTQVQHAAYKIVLDRMIGEFPLHENCFVVCAGNREEDASFVTPMPSALKSRLIHLNIRLDSKAWFDYAYKAQIDPRIITYLQYKPSMLANSYTDSAEESYACPRTWEFASKLIKDVDLTKVDMTTHVLLSGAVGNAAASDFIAYTRYFSKLPKYEDIVSGKAKPVDNNDSGLIWATISMLAEKAQEADLATVFKYLRPTPVDFRFSLFTMLHENKYPNFFMKDEDVAAEISEIADIFLKHVESR